MERKLKMKMCDFCKAGFDDDFYYKLLDNPFTRLNNEQFVSANISAFISKYHIDKSK
jgi:hypothetical protein